MNTEKELLCEPRIASYPYGGGEDAEYDSEDD